MTERDFQNEDVIDLGTVTGETRGTSAVGPQDTDRPLCYVIGLSDQD